MSLSKIIKSSRQGGQSAILVARRSKGSAEGQEGGFHALSSMWQSDDEVMKVLSPLEAERERLQKETDAIRAENDALIAAARDRVAQIEKEAYDKGFAVGQNEALAQETTRLDQIMAELKTLLENIETDRQRLFAQYESEVVTLIKAMVDRVLFHEVTTNPQVIEVCLRTALAYVVENSKVTVRVHGQDLERLKKAAMERPEMLTGYKKIDLNEDPSVSPGGCFLETSFGEIDATLDSRRDKVYSAIDAILKKAVTAGV